ncbi:MAG: penicillin acylase family protein [Acetobacteraceae bacterium]|nr:penicillin acylase family protein [Acetobacteraceae bacterium]
MPITGLPLADRVTIRWNEQAVPYIEAASDGDLAFALGLVHAHLREGQLALGKRIAYGRLSEVIGPLGAKLDRTLRILDFAGASDAVIACMPEPTREWMQRFVHGLNWFQDHAGPSPLEYRVLGMRREPWTIRDLLAMGRVAGADINWLTYFKLIGYWRTDAWPLIWRRVLGTGLDAAASFDAPLPEAAFFGSLLAYARTGSNSLVVSPGRSATGSALLAADPHLPLLLPNLWLLVGVRSPSYRVVGLMPAGLPIFGLGRNETMAWAGTNMRAAASDLYDVSALALTSRTERLRTRFSRSRAVEVRHSILGPVISDSPLFHAPAGKTIALRWMGHQPSDEITAFLKVQRATTPEEFRVAFASYGVGGQNMQFADKNGNIGQVMAVWLPARQYTTPPDLVLDATDPKMLWQGYRDATQLPWSLNPKEGALASANNLPSRLDPPVSFFPLTSERIERLRTLLSARDKIAVADLRALQCDVVSSAAFRLKQGFVRALDEASATNDRPDFVTTLRGWDGAYRAEAAGPVAFETLLHAVTHRLQGRSDARSALRTDWTHVSQYLLDDLAAVSPAERAALLRAALRQAARDVRRYPTWGDMHRLRIGSVFGLLPLFGPFFVRDYPTAGSRETVMKTAHGLVRKRHRVTYGSQARFIADLSHPDASWFVLLGGQDGHPRSPNYADQIGLWREGTYVQMPLTEDAVHRAFPRVQVLSPARAA